MTMQDSLGLAIFMPNCAFQVELDRESIDSGIDEIDEALNQLEIDADDESRVSEVMQNAFALSMALCNNEMESTTALSEMAFAFLYVYKKQKGSLQDNTRGIIAFLTREYIHFSTCDDASVFDENVLKAKALHAKVLGDALEDRTPPKPTLH